MNLNELNPCFSRTKLVLILSLPEFKMNLSESDKQKNNDFHKSGESKWIGVAWKSFKKSVIWGMFGDPNVSVFFLGASTICLWASTVYCSPDKKGRSCGHHYTKLLPLWRSVPKSIKATCNTGRYSLPYPVSVKLEIFLIVPHWILGILWN